MKTLHPIAALALGCVLAIAVGELVLSHLNVIDNPPGQFRRSASRAFEHKPGFKGKDRYGNPIRINSYGMRDREFSPGPHEGVYRILVLGDSVAFGDGVRGEDTFSKQLEAQLNAAAGSPVEVLNTGTRGYNTLQESLLLKEVGLAFQPDLVLLLYVNNDAEPLDRQAGLIDKKYGWLIDLKDFIRAHSYLYAFFRKNLEVMRHRVTPEKFTETYVDQFDMNNEGWKASRDALKEIQALGAERGFRFIVAVYPELQGLGKDEVYPPQLQKVYDQVMRACQELGIPTLDLLSEMKGQNGEKLRVTQTDGFHPNPEGHRLLAHLMARHLESGGYLTSQAA